MSTLAKIFNVSYRIAVIQYMRDDFGVGNEERLHWALLVITDEDDLRGRCFQAMDRTYTDGRVPAKVWYQHYAEVSLIKTKKCLGGVAIGSVKARELEMLTKMINDYKGQVTREGWNCKAYVLELVRLLTTKGWIADRFVKALDAEDPREDFYKGLRVASQATVEKVEKGELPEIHSLD